MFVEHGLSLVRRASRFAASTAIIDSRGEYTYQDLLDASQRIGSSLLNGLDDLAEQRVAFLLSPGFEYVAVQWAIWRAGGIAVPLATTHPPPELEFVIDATRASTVVVSAELTDRVVPISQARSLRIISATEAITWQSRSMPAVDQKRRAMILFTSGTTAKPKGVVTTHANIQAQVQVLVDAWEWTPTDHVLHVLPLHHVHGIINLLTCALWAAKCEMLPGFSADLVWRRLGEGGLTLFMAVPTIFAKLISAWENAPPAEQQKMSAGCAALRLMVSGSAALPVTTLEKWKSMTGHVLLERYGMTEIGMALSNSVHGERIAGHVGAPLPTVVVRRVDENGAPAADNVPAELHVRGPSVFLEYWNDAKATQDAFQDGWFCTGDVTVVDEGAYRILGRQSVDIIKTGGYKVSALEIEEVLRTHSHIQECAVVGMADDEWGERVCACVVLEQGKELPSESFRDWAKRRLAVYKVPSRLLIVDKLPRNAMGKVQKPAVVKLFQRESGSCPG